MMEDQRKIPFWFRVRPSVKLAIEASATEKGQTLTIWAERAFIAALEAERSAKTAKAA